MRIDPLELVSRLPLPFLERCPVPPDLDAVRGRGEETPARETGADPAGVARIWDVAEALYRTGITPALQLCIRHRGAVLLDRSLGLVRGGAPRDPKGALRVPATPETPFCLYSASKLVTAMLIHWLDERGLVHLEDRVADYVPEFARDGKSWITLRHLLTHRSGIPNVSAEMMDLDVLARPELLLDAICSLEPSSRAGRMVAYHAISSGFVLGEVVRRAAGVGIDELVVRAFGKPLGLHWLRYGVEPHELDQVAEAAVTGPPPPPPVGFMLKRALGHDIPSVVRLTNDPRFLTAVVPSANLVSNARELSRFLDCLCYGGEIDGTRILEERTIWHARSEQSYREIDLTLFMPLRYGLGPMLGDDPVGLFGPYSGRAFGHLGFSNIFSWADPSRGLSVALLTSGKPIVSTHVVRVLQLLWEIAAAFPRQRD